ncbi:glycosyltransferase [Oleidesulfovibrio sp.]|uniref:glycosyltransferase n=1 Tax=Oleidesulfovibrio sp. TaxID=2909707 RepID=UPI003A880C1E
MLYPQGKKQAKKESGIAADAKVVLFLAHGGQNAAYKAGNNWISVWKQIENFPEVLCMMAGGDTTEQYGRLLILPYLDRTKLSLVLSAADILVYPSLGDNHPLVVLEALSAKTPVVAFAEGGIIEQIQHGQTGLITKPGDWNSLTAHCKSLLRSTHQLKTMGKNARSIWKSSFTAEQMVLEYRNLFEVTDE